MPTPDLSIFKKHTDPVDIFGYIVPTSAFYYQVLPAIAPVPQYILTGTTIIVGVILFLNRIFKKHNDYGKAIAQSLATGYYYNFFHNFASFIKEKKVRNEKISIRFQNESEIISVPAVNLTIKTFIPRSKDELAETINYIISTATIATLENYDRIYVQYDADKHSAVILEYPRTLETMAIYLDEDENEYTNRRSIKLHKYFLKRFEREYGKFWKMNQNSTFVVETEVSEK